MNATKTPKRTCHALLDDPKELLRECGAPATLCVRVTCLVPGENYGTLIDKYYCCSNCAPQSDPSVGVSVEPMNKEAK